MDNIIRVTVKSGDIEISLAVPWGGASEASKLFVPQLLERATAEIKKIQADKYAGLKNT